MQRRVDPRVRGRVFGLEYVLYTFWEAVGTLVLGGALGGVLPPRGVAGVMAGVAALWMVGGCLHVLCCAVLCTVVCCKCHSSHLLVAAL